MRPATEAERQLDQHKRYRALEDARAAGMVSDAQYRERLLELDAFEGYPREVLPNDRPRWRRRHSMRLRLTSTMRRHRDDRLMRAAVGDHRCMVIQMTEATFTGEKRTVGIREDGS